jgi:hypothetical protein
MTQVLSGGSVTQIHINFVRYRARLLSHGVSQLPAKINALKDTLKTQKTL